MAMFNHSTNVILFLSIFFAFAIAGPVKSDGLTCTASLIVTSTVVVTTSVTSSLTVPTPAQFTAAKDSLPGAIADQPRAPPQKRQLHSHDGLLVKKEPRRSLTDQDGFAEGHLLPNADQILNARAANADSSSPACTTTRTVTRTRTKTSTTSAITTVTTYAACASNNRIGNVHGYGISGSQRAGVEVYNGGGTLVDTDYHCCVLCFDADNTDCAGYFYGGGKCYFWKPNSNVCTQQSEAVGLKVLYDQSLAPDSGFIVGNGVCGRFTKSAMVKTTEK